jgi:limonene-1,2-epoxide hydrolase
VTTHEPARGTASPEDTVRAFLTALERFDIDAAGELLDPDVVYENVSLPAAHGRAATLRLLRSMPRALSAFEARTHRLAATGPVVLTERTDVLVVGRVRVAFWVCGIFEVHDGRLTLWRDYFDWAATTGALASGVVRALGSLLGRRRTSTIDEEESWPR